MLGEVSSLLESQSSSKGKALSADENLAIDSPRTLAAKQAVARRKGRKQIFKKKESVTYARAVFNYNPQNPETQIGFEFGSVLEVVVRGPPSGWSRGRDRNGKVGFFPTDLVKFVAEEEYTKLTSMSETKMKTNIENEHKLASGILTSICGLKRSNRGAFWTFEVRGLEFNGWRLSVENSTSMSSYLSRIIIPWTGKTYRRSILYRDSKKADSGHSSLRIFPVVACEIVSSKTSTEEKVDDNFLDVETSSEIEEKDVGESSLVRIVVSRGIDSGSLDQAIAVGRRLTDANILKWTLQLLHTLHYCHCRYFTVGYLDVDDIFLTSDPSVLLSFRTVFKERVNTEISSDLPKKKRSQMTPEEIEDEKLKEEESFRNSPEGQVLLFESQKKYQSERDAWISPMRWLKAFRRRDGAKSNRDNDSSSSGTTRLPDYFDNMLAQFAPKNCEPTGCCTFRTKIMDDKTRLELTQAYNVFLNSAFLDLRCLGLILFRLLLKRPLHVTEKIALENPTFSYEQLETFVTLTKFPSCFRDLLRLCLGKFEECSITSINLGTEMEIGGPAVYKIKEILRKLVDEVERHGENPEHHAAPPKWTGDDEYARGWGPIPGAGARNHDA